MPIRVEVGTDIATIGVWDPAHERHDLKSAKYADYDAALRLEAQSGRLLYINQIEIVFGILYRRAIARASFPSLSALKERLLGFIDYFNRTFARAFRWTYTGRPVKAQPQLVSKTKNVRKPNRNHRHFGLLVELVIVVCGCLVLTKLLGIHSNGLIDNETYSSFQSRERQFQRSGNVF